ncbi:hypothetical protein GLOTRDRAFT_134256 [Gloeophyllum trabeum ATCC 11539]|uniref:Uncharacterized protein n=1 Tax=Gloeophyllum trabeum (strain ATCC 11539 / FP-39264 / Madison 617) TaxID=670483 RepID=S7R6T7_GLOTA|nr:uncharacterized protein GLOTRDRAFT_134256 [Gloeophyllum trabeum ATCC 11539]EPQ50100.1 hypothetical protein GLOTRDRAFT_134256 [Gloeophyllum trabeum ATCC 11539]
MAANSTPAPSDVDDEINAFMEADSPNVSPLPQRVLKRARLTTDDGMSGTEDGGSEGVTSGSMTPSGMPATDIVQAGSLESHIVALQASHNRDNGSSARVADFVKKEGKRMKLSAEGVSFCQTWATRPPSERDALIMLKLQALTEKVNEIVKAQPKYEITDDFKKNIEKHATATLLSSRLSHYKGSVPCSATENLLKKYCANDLPANYDRNVADSTKVRNAIQTSQTQTRSKWKKLIRGSLQHEDKGDCPDIYTLTKTIVDGQCAITPAVCARVALMRKVYATKGKEDEHNYWSHVDRTLASMRDKAKTLGEGDGKKAQHKLNKAMTHILDTDRDTYGRQKEDQTEQDEQEGYQEEVDEYLSKGGVTEL